MRSFVFKGCDLLAQTRTYTALISEMKNRASKAIQHVAQEMVEQLRFYLIEDFYNMYDPVMYQRTNQLKDSPTYEMLSENMAKVFIDMNNMEYRDASGSEVVNLAALGFHGNTNIFRPGFFWDDFIEWADNNVPTMLKNELKKQGLNVK